MTAQIYLDNGTTTAPSEGAIGAMMPYWTTYWGVPSAPHRKGQELYPFLSKYYRSLYEFLGADKEDRLVFTSSGAEAINHAIFSAYRDITLPTGKNHFLSGGLDEASSILAGSSLEGAGCVARTVEVNAEGIVTVEALADRLTSRTALFSLSWANGLTGVIQPLREIADLCKERGVRFHLDASHVVGKLYFDPEETGADYITFDGDRLHAPKGTGILYVKKGISCSPFIFGSADQAGMRAGNLNVPLLAALACAVEEAAANRDFMCTEVARLRNRLESGVLLKYPEARVCFGDRDRLPHCSTILFPGIANEAMLFALNRRSLYASIGGGSFQQLGLMLASTGMDSVSAHSAVAFTLSRYTKESEIDRAIDIIAESAGSLARLSDHIRSTGDFI